MSTVTVGQLCELFSQIAEGKITGEAIQELIEKASRIALSRLFEKTIRLARKTASEISDVCLRAEALTAIAKALAEARMFDQARKTASEISNTYLRAEALAAVAAALAEAMAEN